MSHTVTGLSPNYGAIGDSVTITGTGFGASQGASTVAFGAVAVASYTSWADTSIVVVVPAATVSARVTVTVSGASQSDFKTSWFEIEDNTVRGVEDLNAQDETNDSSPEDWRYADARDYNKIVALLNNSLVASVNDFRLSLVTADPVPSTDQTAKTSVYLTPFKGNRIALYTGRHWAVHASAEVSLALGTLADGTKPYDVFAYSSSGTVTLEFLVWSSTTARATALVRQDGVWCKTGALTRRYVGTFMPTATTTTEDSEANRYLFNADNRVPRSLAKYETGTTWTYTTNTLRPFNNSTANRVNFVTGLDEEVIRAQVTATVECSVDDVATRADVGVDSTSTGSATLKIINNVPAAYRHVVAATYHGRPGVGQHYLQFLEASEATGTTTWYGVGGDANFFKSGIVAETRM